MFMNPDVLLLLRLYLSMFVGGLDAFDVIVNYNPI